MKDRTVTHATFTLERTYDAAPERVFAAWSKKDAKAPWFLGPNWEPQWEYELDFRIGGTEINRRQVPDGRTSTYDACFLDIVPAERIVYSYDMHIGGERISVSLVTVELRTEGGRTHLTYTEQGAFLDGLDEPAWREQGTSDQLDALGALLAG
ncbi:MAG: SRPBCC family protein [Propionibacteriales bacterium]|nr:SRPBCC family protein [Propionibacteriales bacterium]